MLKKPIKKELKIIIPKHVAIIMDGNNRWTKKKNYHLLWVIKKVLIL